MAFTITRSAGDWLPVSAHGNWSARFRQTGESSSADQNITLSLPRYVNSRGSSRSASPLPMSESKFVDAEDSTNEKASRFSRRVLRPDTLIPRRKVTGTHQLMAAVVGVWLAIVVILTCTERVSSDFDPLRGMVQKTKEMVSPFDKRIQYVGRWSRNKAEGSASGLLVSTYFQGAYADIGFTGTSLGIHLGNFKDPVTVSVRIDDARDFTVVPYGREIISLAQNLAPDIKHVARVMFGGQARRTDIEAFYVDRESSLVDIGKPKTKIIEVVQDTYNAVCQPFFFFFNLRIDLYH